MLARHSIDLWGLRFERTTDCRKGLTLGKSHFDLEPKLVRLLINVGDAFP